MKRALAAFPLRVPPVAHRQRSAIALSVRALGLLAVSLLVFSGCGDGSRKESSPTATFTYASTPTFTPSPSPTATPDPGLLLAENRDLWWRTGAIRYRMIERVSCFCFFDFPHLVAIEVLNDRITSVRDVWTGTEVINPPPDLYRTVDGIFDLLQDAVITQADQISVEYSPHVGAPTKVFVDYDASFYDEEIGIEISDMVIWASLDNRS